MNITLIHSGMYTLDKIKIVTHRHDQENFFASGRKLLHVYFHRDSHQACSSKKVLLLCTTQLIQLFSGHSISIIQKSQAQYRVFNQTF